MLSPSNVIFALKVAVAVVTVLLLASLMAVARGNYRLHGRINTLFFVLTLTALVGLELVARLMEPDEFRSYFDATNSWSNLRVHLSFAVPAAMVLPLMLYTGRKGKRRTHLTVAVLFGVLWTGTFITGVFFLPHTRVSPDHQAPIGSVQEPR
jgi:uncharacterized membrane protein YozB (DUF420 family)